MSDFTDDLRRHAVSGDSPMKIAAMLAKAGTMIDELEAGQFMGVDDESGDPTCNRTSFCLLYNWATAEMVRYAKAGDSRNRDACCGLASKLQAGLRAYLARDKR